ncbi:MAG: hypothetical protein J5910_08085 [Lachnospiraceae bacterium]|nr:hypothetical protein [Lachnospiraceae bacterium]
MDGFRERLGGRYDRSGMRGSGYERQAPEDRYESDRFERTPRRNAPEGVSRDEINESVNEAITKSNREQLNVIADFFDEAKADRMESERAIIDAISHSINDASAAPSRREPAAPIAVVDEANAETLARIERIAGQNAEVLSESNEMLVRNVESLRSNAEVLNELKNSSSELSDRITRSLQELSANQAPQMQDLTVDFSNEKNEIIGAIGDNRAILNMIRQDVLNGFAKNSEEEEEGTPTPFTAEDAEKLYKELEDHVHKECVKCYRNVQSALAEQNTEESNGLSKSVSGLRIMVLVTLILNVVSLILYILYDVLGILSF